MQIAAASVEDYLSRVSDAHRPALARVRDLFQQNVPTVFEEGTLYGMIGWYVPPERYGHTYNGQPLALAALASQKNYMALYLTGVYDDPAVTKWFSDAFADAGTKLDMGKSCLRFRSLDDLPLDVIATVAGRLSVDDIIATHERAHGGRKLKPVVRPGRPSASAKPVVAAKKASTSKAKPVVAAKNAAAKKVSATKAKPVAAKKPAATKAEPVAAKKAAATKAKPAAKKAAASKARPAAKKAAAKKPAAKKATAAKKSPARKRK